MANIYKFLNTQITLNGTGSTVNSANLVRICHEGTGSTSHIITQKYANGAIRSTFTIMAQTEIIIEKDTTDTLTVDGGTDVTANRIAYKN